MDDRRKIIVPGTQQNRHDLISPRDALPKTTWCSSCWI